MGRPYRREAWRELGLRRKEGYHAEHSALSSAFLSERSDRGSATFRVAPRIGGRNEMTRWGCEAPRRDFSTWRSQAAEVVDRVELVC